MVATATLAVGPAAEGAGNRSSGIVGAPVAFVYHAPNQGPDRVLVGVWMTAARHSRTGRYTRDQIHHAKLTAGGSTAEFRLGLTGGDGLRRGTCFLATMPAAVTTTLGSKRPGDRLRATLTIAGHAFTRTLTVRRGDIDGSTQREERIVHAAGCRHGGAELPPS